MFVKQALRKNTKKYIQSKGMDEDRSEKEKPKKEIRRRHKRVLNLLQQEVG